jgi:RHS repeat-associated protein
LVSSGATYSKRTYYRDNRDRITSWVKSSSTSTNPLENGRGDAYTYDAEGQLTVAKYEATTPNTTPGTPQRTESFIFDALGNRKGVNQLAARGSVTFSRKDTGVNEYSSWTPSSISYDTDGSLTAEGWISASYNALNQPISIASPSLPSGYSTWFGYDPLGRPVKRWNATTGAPTTNPATYLYYEGWDLIAEGSDSTVISRIYAHGNRIDEIVADSNVTAGTWAYHHYDARTHCILLTDAPGNVLEQYDYDAFGKAYFYDGNGNSLTTSTWGNRFLFAGREWLSDLGVYDFRHRLYHAELGRFVQPDPKEFEAKDYNLYRYCHNDPVNKVDPEGFEEEAGDEDVEEPPSLEELHMRQAREAMVEETQEQRDRRESDAKIDRALKTGREIISVEREIRSIGERLQEHEEKLEDYKRDPEKNDNKGLLSNPLLRHLRDRIIQGRVRELQKQIRNYKNIIARAKEELQNLRQQQQMQEHHEAPTRPPYDNFK